MMALFKGEMQFPRPQTPVQHRQAPTASVKISIVWVKIRATTM
jgi:hypothetical protein